MAEGRIVFTGANLLDGENPAKPGTSVVIEGNRIATVSDGPVETGPDDRVIDLAGKTLMPGMVSSHFHTGFGPTPAASQPPILGLEAPAAYMGALGARNLKIALECGVTSIIGSSNGDMLDLCLKEAMILDVIPGPRILACTREFMASGDMADGMNRAYFMDIHNSGLTRRVDGVDGMRQAVREELGRGCDIVKISASPGHGSAPVKDISYYTQDELDAAAATAHELGKRVRAHCASRKAILNCARAGFDIIDHADRIDAEGIDAVLAADASVVPSMLWSARFLAFAESWDHDAAVFPIGEGFPEKQGQIFKRLAGVREDFEYTCKILPELISSGVRLLVGDDFGFPMMPHGDYVSEYEVYTKQLGIAPLEVIKWATKNGAEAMGMGDELGTITSGKLADLLVVDGDPAADVSCLRDRVVAIMQEGEWVRDGLGSA